MGIFDGLKKVKNFFTGGGIDIIVQIIGEAHLRKPFKIQVDLVVQDKDVKADKVYLMCINAEEVSLEVSTYNSSGSSTRTTFKESTILYEEEIIFEERILFRANESYTYETEIQLPIEVFPSFEGVHANLVWSLQAFIERPGKNPKSDKVIFEPLHVIN